MSENQEPYIVRDCVSGAVAQDGPPCSICENVTMSRDNGRDCWRCPLCGRTKGAQGFDQRHAPGHQAPQGASLSVTAASVAGGYEKLLDIMTEQARVAEEQLRQAQERIAGLEAAVKYDEAARRQNASWWARDSEFWRNRTMAAEKRVTEVLAGLGTDAGTLDTQRRYFKRQLDSARESLESSRQRLANQQGKCAVLRHENNRLRRKLYAKQKGGGE